MTEKFLEIAGDVYIPIDEAIRRIVRFDGGPFAPNPIQQTHVVTRLPQRPAILDERGTRIRLL